MLEPIKRLQAVEILIVLSIFMSGCTAHKRPSDAEKILANVAKDIVIPIEAEDLRNPLPLTPAAVGEGRQTYMQSCAVCHGADGHGQTSLGQAMYPPAMDLTSPHVQHWDDGELYWIIQNGVRLTGMPSWKGILSEEEMWGLVHFIRQLPNPTLVHVTRTEEEVKVKTRDESIAKGRTLYRQEACFVCHRLDGEGGKVGPDLTVEGNRGRSAEWLVGHFKNPGAYVPGSIMPSFKNLTDEQLNSLTVFLMNQKGAKGQNDTHN
ncbi:MAG: c-type cytochrome [Acidobacteriia bacterium]|nr:c-type cytochrome [Terriglobia bacterium]